MGNVTETLADEFARLVATYREKYGDPSGTEAWNLIADFSVEHAAKITTALSVPCLQEPALIQHRVHFNEDGCPTGWRSGDGAGVYTDSPILRVEVRKLYAQPIEVREQAIRECAEILNDYIAASRSHSEALGFQQARDRILALLEGR